MLNGDVSATNVGKIAIISAPVDLNGARTFTVTNSGIPLNLEISGVISNGTLIKEGKGTLQLSGGADNTYEGGTFVNDGRVWLNKDEGFLAIPGDPTIGDGNGEAGSAVVQLKQSHQIEMHSAVTLKSDGALDLNGFAQAVGSVEGDAGSSINLGSGGVLNTGVGGTSTTYAGVISGDGVIIKTGVGTWTLSGANTYGGTTNIAGGTVRTQNASALGTSNVIIGGLGKLVVSGTLNVEQLFWSGKVQLAPGKATSST